MSFTPHQSPPGEVFILPLAMGSSSRMVNLDRLIGPFPSDEAALAWADAHPGRGGSWCLAEVPYPNTPLRVVSPDEATMP